MERKRSEALLPWLVTKADGWEPKSTLREGLCHMFCTNTWAMVVQKREVVFTFLLLQGVSHGSLFTEQGHQDPWQRELHSQSRCCLFGLAFVHKGAQMAPARAGAIQISCRASLML